MDISDKIRRKIKGYEAANRGERPTSIVVSWDVYYEIKEDVDNHLHIDIAEDRMYGMIVSVLQGDKNNQILLFR